MLRIVELWGEMEFLLLGGMLESVARLNDETGKLSFCGMLESEARLDVQHLPIYTGIGSK
jgi:hypothetical protein